MCRFFFFFFYNHLEIGDESQITAGGWRDEQMFSFKNESLFREQILHFTCDINLYFLNSFIIWLDYEGNIQGHIPQFS